MAELYELLGYKDDVEEVSRIIRLMHDYNVAASYYKIDTSQLRRDDTPTLADKLNKVINHINNVYNDKLHTLKSVLLDFYPENFQELKSKTKSSYTYLFNNDKIDSISFCSNLIKDVDNTGSFKDSISAESAVKKLYESVFSS